MDWIEVTARTVDDAKELALDRLGVVEDELEFEVLDEPKGGLFGLGRADARIRARVKPISRDKPVDRRRRRGRPERSGSGSTSKPRSTATTRESSGSARSGGGETTARSSSGSGSTNSRSRRRRGGRGGGRSGEGGARPSGAANETVGAVTGDEEAEVEGQPVTAQAEHAQKFTQELVRTMGFGNASVRSDIEDDDIEVRVDGDDLGVLVGPRGVTLRALEEVVRAATQHFSGGNSARLHVDVAGYNARRREALAEFARKIATEVKDTQTSRALEPMHAPDRKVVHDTVAEIEGVSTASEGEEPRRRVVINPA